MDIEHQALADEQRNYLAKSYGRYLETLYAHFFADKVGRIVLDGAVEPSISNFQLKLTREVGFDQAFSSFGKDCPAKKNSALPSGKDRAIVEMQRLFSQGVKKPLPTNTSERTLGETMMVLGTASAMYDSEADWRKLRKAITQAQDSYGDRFVERADEYTGRQKDGNYPNNEFDPGAIIDCLDFDEPHTIAQTKRGAKIFEAQAPLFEPYLAYAVTTCKYFNKSEVVNVSKKDD
jgi:pimeloyl-ACP methyl ester carboxylesterase